MKKVIVVGSAGMAGHIVYKYLASLGKYHLVGSARTKGGMPDTVLLDVRDQEKTRQLLVEQRPDVVINCVGMLVQACDDHPDDAALINGYFPHSLARLGRELNFRLIHISTDCVFSGRNGGYGEGAFCDGETMYARSKALGEVINDRDLTIRTSIIGPELKSGGTGLFHWFMGQRGKINGYDRVFWTGVTTLELARAIDAFIEQGVSGLYHLVPERKISKHELLCLMQNIWKREDVTVGVDSSYVSDKSLCNSRRDFQFNVQGYQEMLEDLYRWMVLHHDLYQCYYPGLSV